MKQSLKLFLFVLSLSLLPCFMSGQSNLYVSPTGNDSNSGTIGSPLKSLQGARDKIRSNGVPSGGVIVNFRAGRYPITNSVLFRPQDSGSSGAPIIYTGYQNEEVIFDGLEEISNTSFTLATNNSELHTSATGNVYVQTITDTALIDLLKESTSTQMSMDDQMMTISRFPNIGFATMNNTTINNSVETAPATSGRLTPGTPSGPKGAKFNLQESFNASKWNAELNRTGDVYVRGYMSADWFKNTLKVNSVSSSGQIHLRDGSRYGIKNRVGEGPNRLYFGHLLCELDEPGEWYFDTSNNKLYIWPFSPITSNSKIGVWAGTMVFNISSVSYMTIRKITFQNIGKGVNGDGVVNIKDLSNNINVEGCVFRFIAEPVTSINMFDNVTNSKVLSCDFYDQFGNRMRGGSITPTSVTYGNNSFENCHFTQIYSKDFYGGVVGISGAGNTFKNNLVHNMNGQPITYAGVDHRIELNEVFNVGVEEGDGGAIYCGNDVISYGNKVQNNFIHHIMSIPSLLGRASIFSDDFDGGDSMLQNVTYKGGWEVLKMNGGAGHTVQYNVILDGYRGIRQGVGGSSAYNTAMEYINSTNGKTPTSGDKLNYIGRMLQKVGVSGWETGLNETNWYSKIEPFWKSRYPFFDYSMKAYSDNNKMNAYQCRYYDNMFWSNNKDVELGGGTEPGVLRSQTVNLSIFENPDNLNFKFKEPRPSYAPDIPFQNIGLYADSFRCAIPNKDDYRRNVKQYFEDLASHTPGSYNSDFVNNRLYYNTGKMIHSLNQCTGYFTETAFDIDFGTKTSAIASGHVRASHVSTPGLYGWTNISGLDSRDRGTPNGQNDFTRDIVYASQVRTFEVNIPNGTYAVTITFGDTYAHDNMNVKAEGTSAVTNLSTNANQYKEESFTTTVNDGKLSLEFSDTGGSDPNWVVNRVTIKEGSQPTSTTSYFYDFGTTGSAVQSDYTRVSPTTTGVFGWTNVSNLDSRDRGTANGQNALTRDIVYSSQTRVFEATVPNGNYSVTIGFGDTYAHDNINVKAEGVQKIFEYNISVNRYTKQHFTTSVSDGKLSLEFSDGGGTDANWVINSVDIVPIGTAYLYDFGTTGSPLQSGYQRVSQNTTGSFGWTNTSGINSIDRGNSIGGSINRDLVYSNITRTFEATVPNGDYTVVIGLGDTYMHDNINVKAEGVSKLTNSSIVANVFNDMQFTTSVTDGKLSLEFSDGGGTDVNWIANKVEIMSAAVSGAKEAKSKTLNENEAEGNIEDKEEFRFYPNPVGDVLNIEIPRSIDLKTTASLVFYDTVGNAVVSKSITNHSTQVTLNHLSSGVYMIVLSTNDKVIRTRLVKK